MHDYVNYSRKILLRNENLSYFGRENDSFTPKLWFPVKWKVLAFLKLEIKASA